MTGNFRINRCARVLAAALVCVSATCLPAAAYAIETVRPHGAWHGFVADEADETGFGISARAGDDSTFALIVKENDIALMMACPNLQMTVGQKLPILMTIDGVRFGGDGVIVKQGMIKIPDIDNDVVEHLARGNRAKIWIGGKRLVWNVSLDGFSKTLRNTMKAFVRRI